MASTPNGKSMRFLPAVVAAGHSTQGLPAVLAGGECSEARQVRWLDDRGRRVAAKRDRCDGWVTAGAAWRRNATGAMAE